MLSDAIRISVGKSETVHLSVERGCWITRELRRADRMVRKRGFTAPVSRFSRCGYDRTWLQSSALH